MYDYLDEVLKKLIRQIYTLFQQYRAMPFDELNQTTRTYQLYEELEALNFSAFLDIAEYYYAMYAGAEMVFTEAQLREILRIPSQVMRYAYDAEVIRKRDRLVEAIIATSGSVEEIEKAMRYWTQMTGWFGVEVADAAVKQGMVDTGIQFVLWHSEHDDRTCLYCSKMDGKIFHVSAIPKKPHPGCRCWITAFKRSNA